MEMIHHFTSNQKLKWFGYGEWIEEPDDVSFEHAGFTCKIIRVIKFEDNELQRAFGGYLCGYVRLREGHPWFGKKGDDIDCAIHGGITWSNRLKPGKCKSWLIGFDCAHGWDLIPSMAKNHLKPNEKDPIINKMYNIYEEIGNSRKESYKNIAFAIDVTQDLAEQASEAIHIL